MRTITYYLATNQVVESDAIYPNAFSADDNTTQLVFDYTGTACATWDKWLDLTMSDYTKDVQSLGTGTVVTFNLGAEHTKKGLLQVNPYAKSGTDKHGFPIYKLTIERQLNNSTVDASAQQSMIDYFDDRLTVKAVSATTLAPGESVTASVTTEADGTTYVFGIPQGAQGIQGIQGEKGDMGEVSTAQLTAGLNTKADKLYATNLVTNGDFSNGTTGWSGGNAVLSVLSNVMSITGNGTANAPSGYQTLANCVSGRKYFIKFSARVTNALCSQLRIRAFATSAIDTAQINPVNGTWYNLSNIITANGSGTFQIFATHTYANATDANGAVMELKYVSIIDLTSTFGAGKEPSKEQMDNMLSTFTNSWFNGTVELASIKNIVSLIQVQPAHITPTLLNGWTSDSTNGFVGIRYWLDSLGYVHIEGGVNNVSANTNPIFQLPVGYRKTSVLIASASPVRVRIDANGDVKPADSSTSLRIYLVYKAEA